MKILTMTNTHPDFYRLAGPFLSRREIAKELGGPVWDEDGKMWFLAMDGEKAVGFATMTVKNTNISFDEAYVWPAYRNQGIHTALIEERLAHCPPGSTIELLIFNKSVNEYKQRGFSVKREVGKTYTIMTKKLEGAVS